MTRDLPSIALIGGAGAGKTTLADYLCRTHGYDRVSFATVLKETSRHIWGPEMGMQREKLQRLGVAVRDIDPDAWVNRALADIQENKVLGLPTVVDDCRFPNEEQALRELGFIFVAVYAPELHRLDRLNASGKFTTAEQLQHESERHQTQMWHDYTIYNSQGLQQLAINELEGVLDREARRT